jgi:hypothetical protein
LGFAHEVVGDVDVLPEPVSWPSHLRACAPVTATARQLLAAAEVEAHARPGRWASRASYELSGDSARRLASPVTDDGTDGQQR